jgi:hypothetical protein
MSSADPCPTDPADGVKLVNKYQGRGILFGDLEHIPDPGGPHPTNISINSDPLIE